MTTENKDFYLTPEEIRQLKENYNNILSHFEREILIDELKDNIYRYRNLLRQYELEKGRLYKERGGSTQPNKKGNRERNLELHIIAVNKSIETLNKILYKIHRQYNLEMHKEQYDSI